MSFSQYRLSSESEFEGKVVTGAVRMGCVEWGRSHVLFVSWHLGLSIGKQYWKDRVAKEGVFRYETETILVCSIRNLEMVKTFGTSPGCGVGMGQPLYKKSKAFHSLRL